MCGVIKLICFLAVIGYASVFDVTTRIIPNRVYLLLLLTGLLQAELSSVTGLILTAVPLLITAAIRKNFGGGDVKFGALCGFVLKGTNGMAGLALGSVFCLLAVPIIRKFVKWGKVPLVPFLSAGCAAIAVILQC
jgi:Flp pilus assembly protein protease CpaA